MSFECLHSHCIREYPCRSMLPFPHSLHNVTPFALRVYVCVYVYTSKLFMFRSSPTYVSVCVCWVCARWRLMILKTMAKFLLRTPHLFFCKLKPHLSIRTVANNYYCFCLKLTQEDLQINAHWLRISRRAKRRCVVVVGLSNATQNLL